MIDLRRRPAEAEQPRGLPHPAFIGAVHRHSQVEPFSFKPVGRQDLFCARKEAKIPGNRVLQAQ